MKIIKVVLTGGPCAGKTTMLKEITKYLNEEGIVNIVVPETATELIPNGIMPRGTYENLLFFQDLVMKSQMFKEKQAETYAYREYGELDKVVIIYDRGIIDGKAYLKSSDDFNKILCNNNINEIETLDSYDLVIDLITTADCNRKVYNNSNEARFETADEAIIVDRNTSNAWAGHRNIKIVNTSIPLKEETNIVLGYVSDLIYNIETKKVDSYLVDLSDFKPNVETSNILTEDYYLDVNSNDYDYILKKRNYNGSLSYLLTVKRSRGKEVLTITNKVITQKTFSKLIKTYNTLKKQTYEEISFIKDRQLYRFLIYDGLTIMKVEKNKLNEFFKLPDGINVLKYDITSDEVDKILNGNKKVYKK